MIQTDRKKKLLLTTLTSLGLQVTTVVCGLILPRLFMASYGSEVNGLISSISRFLSLIMLMEAGVGAVVQSALYRPLAAGDMTAVSRVLVSGQRFFTKVSLIFGAYVAALIVFYPRISNADFAWQYTAVLILSISISTFAQYTFGIIDQVLLNAAQQGYVHLGLRILLLLFNTLLTFVLVKAGCSVQMVKLISSLVFLLQPIAIRLYIRRHYRLDRRIRVEGEILTQKWNGMAQHLSYVVLEDTDTLILTMFSTLTNVSVYSVYNGVIYGIKQLIQAFSKGMQALLGDMIARKESQALRSVFDTFEYAVHVISVFVFSCVGILIVPFVTVYTKGIMDADYIQPLFAAVLTLANMIHSMRIPYNTLIMAANRYKETQRCYITAACVNLLISVAAVRAWGLIGVAVGTLIAMLYQSVWMERYVSRAILQRSFRTVGKLLLMDGLSIILTVLITAPFEMQGVSYIAWILLACKVAFVSIGVLLLLSLCFYRPQLQALLKKLMKHL